jgi:predicted N-acetyltransferase YhbS
MTGATQIRATAFHLRSANHLDERFLLELYAQTRADELTLAGMDATQREVFVQMQFRARQASYAASYPAATDQIICCDSGTPVGRVLVNRAVDAMLLVDIAVVTERRGQGLGTQVIQGLQQECRARGLELKLRVLKGNPAERLYQRLGFQETARGALRADMVWRH